MDTSGHFKKPLILNRLTELGKGIFVVNIYLFMFSFLNEWMFFGNS